MIKKIICAIILASLPPFVFAQDFNIGAWQSRSPGTTHENQSPVPNTRYIFLTLKKEAKLGDQFNMHSFKTKRAHCCLVVDSNNLTLDILERNYRIPRAWALDLLNIWGFKEVSPYFVYLAKNTENLYRFNDGDALYKEFRYSGGLATPLGVNNLPRNKIQIKSEIYSIHSKGDLYGSDNDAFILTYTLIKQIGGKIDPSVSMVIDVPFGKN